ncbi:MAG: SDR family NAD(P)-dependent oxidoreductase [Alphaproteobacteria bacterium]|nr:SDR family NAD(P)-dependent oxidoreductase [Alphaproteobacteria bacterium]
MTEKSILITGCSSGIGLAAAEGMKARGWRVFATARQQQDLDRLRNNVGVEPIALELADEKSIAACADHVLQVTDGRIDAVFNNAAFGQIGAVEDLTPEVLREQMDVNLIATHDLTRRLIPAMRANGSGRIVQCSSVLGFVTGPFRGAYCASKYALEALSDAMRHELIDSGIKVSLIEPGPIRSRFVERALVRLIESVDIAGSPHRETYQARIEKMQAGGASIFKLEPEAVVKKLIHAVESRYPKARYYVTIPTYLAAGAKWALPTRVADVLARKM